MPFPTSFTATIVKNASPVPDIAALQADSPTFRAWNTSVPLTYSFPGWGASWGGSDPYSVGFVPLTNEQQDIARSALAKWGAVTNLNLVEVPDTAVSVGDIRFGISTQLTAVAGSDVAAVGYLPGNFYTAGDIWLNPDANSYAYIGLENLFLHEIGHALGLKHPFDADLGQLHTLSSALDTSQYTVMSYTTSPNFPVSALASPSTPMTYDIRAIQDIYGANMATHSTDDVYEFQPSTSAPAVQTLWDAGGNDTISAKLFTNAVAIDLQDGHYSTIAVDRSIDGVPGLFRDQTILTNNIGIAFGATIENAMGGSGNDNLMGNAARNVLTGNAGSDLLDGAGGIDTAVFNSTRASSQLGWFGNEWVVRSAEGVDTVRNTERLQFSDVKVALDLHGAAGDTVKLLGVVFGPGAVANKNAVGIGINLLDQGWSFERLAEMAMEVAGKSNHFDVVSHLWSNLGYGVASAADAAPYVAMLDSGMRIGTLTVAAANLDQNAANVHLVGLSQTGVEFI